MQEKKGSKFFSGLLWGAILGSGAAYVLSSKKRREIARDLIHQGIDLLENAAAPKKSEVEKMINPIPSENDEILEVKETMQTSEPKAKSETKRFFKKSVKGEK